MVSSGRTQGRNEVERSMHSCSLKSRCYLLLCVCCPQSHSLHIPPYAFVVIIFSLSSCPIHLTSSPPPIPTYEQSPSPLPLLMLRIPITNNIHIPFPPHALSSPQNKSASLTHLKKRRTATTCAATCRKAHAGEEKGQKKERKEVAAKRTLHPSHNFFTLVRTFMPLTCPCPCPCPNCCPCPRSSRSSLTRCKSASPPPNLPPQDPIPLVRTPHASAGAEGPLFLIIMAKPPALRPRPSSEGVMGKEGRQPYSAQASAKSPPQRWRWLRRRRRLWLAGALLLSCLFFLQGDIPSLFSLSALSILQQQQHHATTSQLILSTRYRRDGRSLAGKGVVWWSVAYYHANATK